MLVVQVLLSGSWGNHLRWAYLGADPAHSESPGCGYCGMELLVSMLVFGTLIPSLHSQKQNVNDVEQNLNNPRKSKPNSHTLSKQPQILQEGPAVSCQVWFVLSRQMLATFLIFICGAALPFSPPRILLTTLLSALGGLCREAAL